VNSADESAEALRRVFDGEKGPRYDICVLNAAAALVVAERVEDLDAGLKMARAAIESGAVKKTLEKLVACSQG
jgi:anthranilate phosphoribosyltransferase